ncbi:GNAT family N-acetyltransferase [Ruminococcus albus]|uniref:Acetyltransferase (GNAT) domain-containing protein n=1 Tax=Ruminococcus albus TaxID=1264 RepID=A0A1H7L590_RUMAL|nr:GNAT family N-acetyltransferase [Ruminococcus albus]SEK94004.1 Acetyltransferase (GNAT) domain-containing protein [Ruminococcus albus]
MIYRKAVREDIDAICKIITSAIAEMELHNIFQWDSVYPAKEDFLSDIENNTLFVGTADDDIAVVYAVSKEYDEQYSNGNWQYPDSDFRVIHRLCVAPKYQHKGIAGQTLAHIENELRKSRIDSVRLDVFTENPFALSLYRTHGYTEVGNANWRKGRFLLMEKHL